MYDNAQIVFGNISRCQNEPKDRKQVECYSHQRKWIDIFQPYDCIWWVVIPVPLHSTCTQTHMRLTYYCSCLIGLSSSLVDINSWIFKANIRSVSISLQTFARRPNTFVWTAMSATEDSLFCAIEMEAWWLLLLQDAQLSQRDRAAGCQK